MIPGAPGAEAEIERLENRIRALELELAAYRQSEVERQERERVSLLILEHIPNLVGLLHADGTPELINGRIREFTGRTEDELRQWNGGDLLHPADRERVIAAFVSGIAAGARFTVLYRMRRHDGAYRWFEGHHSPLIDERGRLHRWCVSVNDIDDSIRAREALRRSEQDARAIVDGIPGFVGILTPEGAVQLVNRRILEYCGQTLEELQHWGTNGTVHADDMPHVADVFGRSIAAGTPYYVEQRLRRYDGVYRWFGNSGIPVKDDQGQVLRWYILLTDIDEKKRAECALEASERNLRLTIDTIPALAWSANADGTGDFFNRHYLDYVGLSPAQVRDWQWASLIHPDDLKVIERAWDQFRSAGTGGEVEARVRRHDGVYRWFLFRSSPLRDELGNITKWYGVNTDIEDRKRAADELRRREHYLAMGERVSLTGSFAWKPSTDKITCSEQLLRILELDSPAEATADTLRTRVHPDDLPLVEARFADVEKGRENPEFEARLLMPDGRIKYVRVFSQVIEDFDGQRICIGAVQDVTRRRLAEDALDKVRFDLAHLTRITTLGTLAASIAHEVTQPLAGIMTNASTCVRMLTADTLDVAGALENARRTIRDSDRAAEVVSRLRSLFSGRTARSSGVDLNEAAAEVVTLLSSDLQRNGVLVQTSFAEDLPLITADRVQLQQVILNLLRNASDAMSNVDDRQRLAVISTGRDGPDRVRLSVSDSGIGFDAQNAQRLFQAFYTTKEGGMGMGLSVSRSIIESHYGRLWAECPDGTGATFAFSIPVMSDA